MSKWIIGSARGDERGWASGGAAGDQKQKDLWDFRGEVSLENFYVHPKGWVVLRPKSDAHANAIAEAMCWACLNDKIGYDQGNRLGIIKYGTRTTTKTECDCSSLVRQCIREATGVDPGNFTTYNEVSRVMATGLFDRLDYYWWMTRLKTGDILVTKTKGHTVVVTSAEPRAITFPAYTGNSTSIVIALRAVGEMDITFTNRARIAAANGIRNYTGTAAQNLDMVNRLKAGTLVRA